MRKRSRSISASAWYLQVRFSAASDTARATTLLADGVLK
jgi:hypothetical protein